MERPAGGRSFNGLRSRTSPAGCGAGAGADSAWEQRKPEARKLLDAMRAAESQLPATRCIGLPFWGHNLYLKDFLQPLATASACVQNHLSPYSGFIVVAL